MSSLCGLWAIRALRLAVMRPVAMVTGGSDGIGREFARQLCETHDLVLVARRRDRLDALAAELVEAHSGLTVEVIAADLTVPADLAITEVRLGAEDQPVDLLVNCAGFGSTGDFLGIPVGNAEGQIRLNVLALVRLTHAALVAMAQRGSGRIVNVSSTAGNQPVPSMAVYAATKAFVTSFSEAIADEARRHGVRVMALCPGYTHSGFHERAGFRVSGPPAFLWSSPDSVVATALADLEAGRIRSTPGLVNKAVTIAAKVLPSALLRRCAGLLTRRSVSDRPGG